MSGAQIAAEVAAALAEVGGEVGDSPLVAMLKKAPGGDPSDPPQNPFDPDPPEPDDPDPLPVTVVVDSYDKRFIDGEMIQASDRKVLMEATGPVPAQGDTLTIAGKDYAVMSVMPEAPAGVAVMYEVQVRR